MAKNALVRIADNGEEFYGSICRNVWTCTCWDLFPRILFCKRIFFPARFGRRSDIYMQRVFEIKDCSAPRACLQQRTESGQFVSLRSFIFPFFLILSWFCFTRCGRQTFSARQKRCCSWQLPTTSLQDNRTQLPNRIWSLEDKVFQELLTCRFQRLESNLLHQWLFRFRYKFRHDNRCTFLGVRSLMSPISGSKLSFLFSQHKIYLCLLTFWKPSLRGRRPLYLYDFRSFLCKNELLSFLGLSACKCFLCFRLSWTLMSFFCARLELDVSLLLSCCPRQKTSPKVIWIRRETVFAFLPFSRKSWEWVCGCLVSSDQLCLWSGCPALLSFC